MLPTPTALHNADTLPGCRSTASRAWCSASLLVAAALLPVWAQTPSSTERAQERSQQQSDNVYRWIKYFAEQPKKPDAGKPRAKPDTPAPVAVKKPELKGPAAAPETPATTAAMPESIPSLPTATEAQQPQYVSALPAVASVAAPVAVEREVIVEADSPLVPIAVVEPTIPHELRNEAINTKVLLSFTVQTDGTVATPSVVTGSNRRLNRSAIDAITKWRFEPIRSERLTQIEFQFMQE